MSQNFDLGVRYFLCYVENFENHFLPIFYVSSHKNKTRA